MTHPPDAIIFDIGNVLLKFDYLSAGLKLAAKNGLFLPPDRERINQTKEQYEGGLLSREDFLQVIREEFQDDGPEEDLVAIWQNIFEPNQPMIDIVQALHGQVPLFLLSNIGCIHHQHIFERYSFFQCFEGGVFSYQVKKLKPDPDIYALAAEMTGTAPASTVFLDDLAPNVEAARNHGFDAVLYDFKKHERTLEELRARGLKL